MITRILILLVAVSLGGCQLPSIAIGSGQTPAPLATTTIDDSALQAAWKSLDVALDAINLALDAKPSLIGTPGARRVADGIDAVSAALTAAEAAAAGGSTTDYRVALAKAKEAYAELRLALQSLKGA